jgi:hypothetical protein
MRRSLVVILLLTLVLFSSASAQTVVQRVRLGNSVEGMTYVNNGPLAKHIVIIDGETLYGVPAEARGNSPFMKLFDLNSLGYLAAPRGVGYIETEKLFIFTDPLIGPTSTFRLTDHQGRNKGSIAFQWPDDLVGTAPYVEEIAWIPLDSPRYAGKFIFIASQTADPYGFVLIVMDRNGNMVREIPLNQDPNSPYYLAGTGLAYRNGRLLLGNLDGYLFEIDLDGNITAPPVSFPDATDLEGVAVLAKGRVAVTSHSNGKLIFLDTNLNREPQERSYKLGFGLCSPQSAAWNSVSNEYIVYANDYEPTLTLPQLGAVAADLKSEHVYFDMAQFASALLGKMDYQPLEDAVVMPWRNNIPRQLEFFRPTGAYSGPQIGDGSPNYRVVAFAHVPGKGYIGRAVTSLTALQLFDFAAQPTGVQFELAPVLTPGTGIIDVAPFTNGGEQRYLVLTGENPKRLLTLDPNGVVLGSVTITPLHSDAMQSIKYVSSGPSEGAFVAVNSSRNEMVIFTLP